MAFTLFTQSFGSTYANGTVTIVETSTGIPATILATTTGGLVNNQGYATLDGAGDLSVVIDTAKTFTITPFDGDLVNFVPDLSNAEKTAARKVLTGVKTQNFQTGTTYTLALTDAGAEVTMTNGSANTLTIPLNATAAFPIGTEIDVIMGGAGVTTVAITGGGTIVKPAALALAIAAQHQGIRLTKTAINTWRANGI